MNLLEGGNVFKDANGRSLTQRINQTDIPSTVQWVEQVTGLDFTTDRDPVTDYPLRWLGSTGRKPSSGDLDLAIDASKVSKDQLYNKLVQWAQSHKLDPREWVKKTGDSVHLRTPITGRPDRGYVQTDLMFLPVLDWGIFWLSTDKDSEYKGVFRNVLMSSLAKAVNLKASNRGVTDRATNQLVTTDPDQAAKLLLNKKATGKDFASVESIYRALAADPRKSEKVADFEEYARDNGMLPPDQVQENESNFLARLRNRIVNQGMQPLIEAAVRIEHLEDLVFERGTAGIRQAMNIINQAAEDTAGTTTVKWDGKPAILFGRKPTGEFVLTDKSGFYAKGYDGLATSPDMIARIMAQRGGERGELIAIYQKLFPMLAAAVPQNFRGYIQGDLLYTQTPPEVSGAYVFKPNFIEYKIPAASKLGQEIGNSEVGIAIHTYYEDPNSSPTPIKNANLKRVPGLLLIEPTVKDIENVRPDAKLVKQLRDVVRTHGNDIDGLFNPTELRAAGITDFPQLCKKYINSRITTNYDNLLPDFGAWLQKNVTPRKYANIVEYLQSPRSNIDGITAAFTAFLLLHEIKTDMLNQLDRQQPGQEGWVLATQAGRAKLVNRFGFSAGNRILNNPNLVS